MNYTATIHGGEGPDVWDREFEIYGDDFLDAARQAHGRAQDMGGWVYSLEFRFP